VPLSAEVPVVKEQQQEKNNEEQNRAIIIEEFTASSVCHLVGLLSTNG